MKCPKHPKVKLICPACHGSEGGSVTSPRKAEASRINGAKGGRPPTKK